ncbi:hypothetical protein V2G26_017567 [Clonostachys chloroleuca]
MPLQLKTNHSFRRNNLNTASPDDAAPDSTLYHWYLTSSSSGVPREASAGPLSASSSGSRRPSRHHSPSTSTSYQPNETLLDKHTSLDAVAADMADHHSSQVPRPHPHRDSHDLSLSTRDVTRDSLVTNMLVSLDKLSFLHNDAPRFGEEDDEDDLPRFFDIPSRLSSQYSRDRRSNSNATIQDVPRRASLVRETMRRSQSDTPKESPQQGSHRHKSGSVGSGSIDGLQSQGNGYTGGRWGRSHRRSASIDQGSHPSDLSQVDSMTRSLKADRVTSFNSDDLNAAPNPTVPGGPRKPPRLPRSHQNRPNRRLPIEIVARVDR